MAILNYTKLNARQIIDGIAKGDFTSVEVAEALIEQAEAWIDINSLVNFDIDRFLSLAEEADKIQKEGKNVTTVEDFERGYPNEFKNIKQKFAIK